MAFKARILVGIALATIAWIAVLALNEPTNEYQISSQPDFRLTSSSLDSARVPPAEWSIATSGPYLGEMYAPSDLYESPVLPNQQSISAAQTRLCELGREISSMGRKISDTTLKSRDYRVTIPKLESEIAELDEVIPRLADEHATAQNELQEWSESLAARRAKLANAVREAELRGYTRADAQMEYARKQRDEMRRRVGAQPDSQEEIQQTLLGRMAAKRELRANSVRGMTAELERLDLHTAALAERVAETRGRLQYARNRRTENRTKHQEYRSFLESKPEQRLAAHKRTPLAPVASQFGSVPTNPAAFPGGSGYAGSYPFASRYYDPSFRPQPLGETYVNAYVRRDGTNVNGHFRTVRDGSFYNNYSSWGNKNPHTGEFGTKLPAFGGNPTYVAPYFRSDGTPVHGHFRGH